MRKRAPGAGNTRELRVMDVLAAEGWLCASRRHIGGAGDVLAVQTTEKWGPIEGIIDGDLIFGVTMPVKALLIEVKSTSGGPWERCGPKDRQALIETARACGAEPWLYWWPARQKLRRISADEFPPQPQVESEAA